MSESRGQQTPSRGGLSVLITGAGGYVGRLVVQQLAGVLATAEGRERLGKVVATDIRPVPAAVQLPGVHYEEVDVRDPTLAERLGHHRVDAVVHLAAVVTPPKGATREWLHSVDVLGTQNVLQCVREAGVGKVIVTSSGAAYGYHRDNPDWLEESHPLRGNPEIPYADHKRQVEEMLARWREEHPEIEQLILRPGTVLGADCVNQITALFDGRFVIGLRGTDTPFVLIWDRDVAEIIVRGLLDEKAGIYNLAGDGAVPMRELAAMMGKPFVALPPSLVGAALGLLQRLGLSDYGPEQVAFLRYRPVLKNERLKRDFPYTPRKNSREVFAHFLEARHRGARP